VGGEGKGELAVWLVKFAWIRACVKAGLLDDPDYPGKNGNFTLNALLVLEDSVSVCLIAIVCGGNSACTSCS